MKTINTPHIFIKYRKPGEDEVIYEQTNEYTTHIYNKSKCSTYDKDNNLLYTFELEFAYIEVQKDKDIIINLHPINIKYWSK